MIERGRVALREIELRLDDGGRETARHGHRAEARRRTRRFRVTARIPAHLGRMRIHVIIDVLLDLGLGGEAPPAIGHRTAERPVTLMGARVLVQDRLLTKVLAALLTLVRLLPGVDAQMLIEDRALTEIAAAVHAAVRLLVRVDAQMLREMGLLPKSFAALRARIRPRFDVYAPVLQQGGLLLELLLTDRATHVQRHAGRTSVLYHVGQTALGAALLLDVLQGAEAARGTRTEDRVITALRVLEVSGILDGIGVRRRTERARLRVRVAERRRDLLLALLGREGNILRPERRCHSVLEDEMRAHIYNERTAYVHRRCFHGVRNKREEH